MERMTIRGFIESTKIPLTYRQVKARVESELERLEQNGIIFVYKTKKKKHIYIVDVKKFFDFLKNGKV